MPRPNQSRERRERLLPVIAATFAELGYRRTTIAELAERCAVQENILYRLWPDKKAMFVTSIEYVFHRSTEIWERLLHQSVGPKSTAERLLEYESVHHGEFGLFRIIFAGLNETDDPDIRSAMQAMYDQFHRFLSQQIKAHRGERSKRVIPSAELAAWAVVGLGTVANISRELGLVTTIQRQKLVKEVGRLLREGKR